MNTRVVVLASDNAGKLAELSALLKDMPFEARPQSDYGLTTPPETGQTFAENALLKARFAARHSGCMAIADDSGLVVDALDGAPGLYSARYAGEGASSADNISKLLAQLAAAPGNDRAARYVCALACVSPAPEDAPVEVQGAWEGRVADAPRGDGGFGYDPVFFVPSENCTAAQLPPAKKAALSHRGQALARLRRALRERGGWAYGAVRAGDAP